MLLHATRIVTIGLSKAERHQAVKIYDNVQQERFRTKVPLIIRLCRRDRGATGRSRASVRSP